MGLKTHFFEGIVPTQHVSPADLNSPGKPISSQMQTMKNETKSVNLTPTHESMKPVIRLAKVNSGREHDPLANTVTRNSDKMKNSPIEEIEKAVTIPTNSAHKGDEILEKGTELITREKPPKDMKGMFSLSSDLLVVDYSPTEFSLHGGSVPKSLIASARGIPSPVKIVPLNSGYPQDAGNSRQDFNTIM